MSLRSIERSPRSAKTCKHIAVRRNVSAPTISELKCRSSGSMGSLTPSGPTSRSKTRHARTNWSREGSARAASRGESVPPLISSRQRESASFSRPLGSSEGRRSMSWSWMERWERNSFTCR